MRAVTFSHSGFSLTELAVRNCQSFTGLQVTVLTMAEVEHYCPGELPNNIRLYLWDIFPDEDQLLYFDADLIFQAAWDPKCFPAGLGMVRDIGWSQGSLIQTECDVSLLHRTGYLNAGLILADRSTRPLFKIAQNVARCLSQWQDQTALNVVAAQYPAAIRYLPVCLNYVYSPLYQWYPIVGAHLAGDVPSKELRASLLPTRLPVLLDFSRHAGLYAYFNSGSALRYLVLRPDGTIGFGTTRWERYWFPLDCGGLAICGEEGLTLLAERTSATDFEGSVAAMELPVILKKIC